MSVISCGAWSRFVRVRADYHGLAPHCHARHGVGQLLGREELELATSGERCAGNNHIGQHVVCHRADRIMHGALSRPLFFALHSLTIGRTAIWGRNPQPYLPAFRHA